MSDNIDDIIRRASANVRRSVESEDNESLHGELSDQQKEQQKAAFYAEEQKKEEPTKNAFPQSLEEMLKDQLDADKSSPKKKPTVAVYEVDENNNIRPYDPSTVSTGIDELDELLSDLEKGTKQAIDDLAEDKFSNKISENRIWKLDADDDAEIQATVDKLYSLCEKHNLPAMLQIQTSMQSNGYTVKGFMHKLPMRSTVEMDLLAGCMQSLFSSKNPSTTTMAGFMKALAAMLKETTE